MDLASSTCSCSGQRGWQNPTSNARRLPIHRHRSQQVNRLQHPFTASQLPVRSIPARAQSRQQQSAGTATVDPVLAVCQELFASTQQNAGSALLPLTLSIAAALLWGPGAALALPGVATPLPLQILGFLLNNPIVTLVIAGVAIWAIPRLARAAVRFILIPAAVLGLAYLVISNPQTSFAFAGTALSYVSSHPVITSAVILVGLSFVLSPYILVAGASVLLIGGYNFLPSQFRYLIPAPIVEADKQLTGVRQRLFKSGQELQREAPSVKSDPDDIFGRLGNIVSAN
ncbi:hypothetical protein WJX74_006341 [Apatococcus lobatus]|uniref:Uncharacterized protein n=1 Tax=Apatococcus lobatus TaxID=904363 RepID=A0AAW1SF71_9CHLO